MSTNTHKTTYTPSRHEPPASLSEPARSWWRRLSTEYDLSDAAAELLLETALLAWDRGREADELVAADGMLVQIGSSGRMAAHPAIAVSRDAYATFGRLLKSLNLDIEPLGLPGRPPVLPGPVRKFGD